MPLPSPEARLFESQQSRGIAILGATGSIGENTLDVTRHLGGAVTVKGLTAHSNLDRLVELVREFHPEWIAATDSELASGYPWPAMPGTDLLVEPGALEAAVVGDSVDLIVAAMVGSAGLPSTLAAIDAGKCVALANKETLVTAGAIVMERARRSGAVILPIDSEHNAIFQCLQAAEPGALRRVVLTASGGPFRDWTRDQMASATPEQALAHPTWNMGKKTSIDSATMMNKALEIIEARWLFDLVPDQIEVVIHPQSIVHSMVEFRDGSVLAHLSPPDMRLPIQHALMYPDRVDGPTPQLDLTRPWNLEIFPPDPERFPALNLGLEVASTGGTSGAVLNAANEIAVSAFLSGKIGFNGIVDAVQEVLSRHAFRESPTIEDIFTVDTWAREETIKWISD